MITSDHPATDEETVATDVSMVSGNAAAPAAASPRCRLPDTVVNGFVASWDGAHVMLSLETDMPKERSRTGTKGGGGQHAT